MRDQPTMEWTATIESPAETTRGEEDFLRFDDALRADARALAVACSLDVDRGSVSAIFQVVAGDTLEAAQVALGAFEEALAAAGLHAVRATGQAAGKIVEVEGPRVVIEAAAELEPATA